MVLLLLAMILPILFILPLMFLPERHAFKLSLASSAVLFVIVLAAAYLGITQGFDQLAFQQSYIPSLGIDLSLELNKYTSLFAIMTSIVLLSVAMVAKEFIKESKRMYNVLFLTVSGSALGVFLSGNLFLLFVFWEVAEIVVFFMIYIFGGYDRRYAAIKFILYSATAGLFFLIGMMVLYTNLPSPTLSIQGIISQSGEIPQDAQLLAMVLMLFAFLIKTPSFPFHSWLPDAHTEAPTTGSMILAGILLKFGGYGILLIMLMLPVAIDYAPFIATLFGISAIFSAFVALRQVHLKRLIAYTSIVDMGIASLGIVSATPLGTAGGVYLMLSHGVVISLLFLLAGAVDESYKTMLISKIRGIVRNFPAVAYSFLFGVFALIGIPLTGGFVGELVLFIGVFSSYGALGLLPLFAVVLLGALMFLILEKCFFNSSKAVEPFSNPAAEVLYAALFLIASTVALGVLPFLLLSPFVP
jgi:proton-translocating NADH-quinone oxidoreductase chain M